jgi:DNA polymerase-3 subunit delta'
VSATDEDVTSLDPWEQVVGQGDAVATLRAAAGRPVHAYLLVGLPGWGTRAAARAFAGDLLAGGGSPDEAARHRRLAAEERHPALTVVERVGASISIDQAREIVRTAQLAPPEGSRQVILLVDFHLVDKAGPALLKTIEEPPPSTYFVILAEEVPAELVTIASRCVRIDFGPIPTGAMVARLVDEGASTEVAEAAAVSAAGDLERARLLVDDPGLRSRRAFWYELPTRLDGTGGRVAELVAEAEAHVEEILAPLQARHEQEMDRAKAEVEEFGTRKGALTDLDARQKREVRRIRTDELRAGLSTVASRYRDAAVAEGGDPAGYASAGRAIGVVTDRLVFNVNERLALEALLLDLPALP